MSKNILFAFLFLMGAIPSIAQKNYQVQSPNRDIKVEVTVADKVTFAIVQDHSEVMNSISFASAICRRISFNILQVFFPCFMLQIILL